MKRLLFTLYLLSVLNLQAQDTKEFAVPHPKAETVTACKGITLKPGFSYKATTSGALEFNINTNVCTPSATTTAISADQNYIMTITPLGQTKSVTYNAQNQIVIDRTTEGDVPTMVTIQYFDGLGRPVQTVQRGITPSGADLITLQEYDSFGRESNTWLPATMPGNNGAFAATATIQTNAMTTNANSGTKDDNPYTKPVYEASPLNRVLEQYGPGADWQSTTNKKAVRTGYLTNKDKTGTITLADSLVCGLYISSDDRKTISISKSKNYTPGELYVTRLKDEDNNVSYEFKDKLGQVVLTRQIADGALHDTYYIYDSFGNLRVVIPPLASDKLAGSATWTDTNTDLQQLAYLYKYDERNRCIAKKLPGADWIYYVYDKANRLIFTQDGEQRTKTPTKEWTFNKYDAFGRIVITGIHKSNETQDALIAKCKDIVVKEVPGGSYGYSWTSLPNDIKFVSGTVLIVNYYDDYDHLLNQEAKFRTNLDYTEKAEYGKRYIHPDLKMQTPKGLLTGTRIMYTDANGQVSGEITNAIYYDNRGRIIQTKSTNQLGGYDKEYIAYNFTGQLTKKLHEHTGKSTQTEVYAFTYDHAGRLLTTTHQLNGGTAVTLAQNTYDELGRLSKNVKNNQANLTTGYTYNVRSWTKAISSPLFKQTLYYNESYGGSVKQYNGNISAMDWTLSGDKTRGYAFTYDNLSRLTAANYLENATANTNYKTAYTYDKQGNIKTLQRYGKTTAGSTFGLIDNLTISHTGNQLLKVDETVANITMSESTDFKNYTNAAVEYLYNSNGAMTQDLNKGISAIQYNSLNLPRLMDIKSSVAEARNEYTYTASGTKLRVVQKWNPNYSTNPIIGSDITPTSLTKTETTDYVGNIIYESHSDGTSKTRILIDGGYIDGTTYYFYLTDHLGNNRVVANANGTVIQKNHYYPFGMAFAETPLAEQKLQPYKYNNKEFDQMNGLNLYDYSARYMDAVLPGFTTTDPLAEKYPSISPYVYCNNNPIRYIDPDGRSYGEFDYINGEWKKISNIGDNIGVDFYHMKGVTNASGKEITNVTDRQGNWIEMSDGRDALKGGTIRGDDVNWKTITNEYIDGNGPTKSVFEGNHEANEAIQEHYLYKNTFADFKASGKPKAPYAVKWSPLDVAKTGRGNKQAQMMGSYNVSFYKIGENTLSFIQDSKSKTSIGLHLPLKNEDRKDGPVYNPWAGTWQKPDNSYKNTYQIYLFWAK